jgi:hypothetical protein
VRQDDGSHRVRHLTTSIGPRRATSLEEARAAAYVDGRLRRAGMKVSADPFLASASPPPTAPLLSLAGILAALLVGWVVIPSLFLSLWLIVLTLFELAGFSLPMPLFRSRDSQNTVGTRASEKRPRWRVVLLAPLDTPPPMQVGGSCVRQQQAMLIVRLIAAVSLAILALVFLGQQEHLLPASLSPGGLNIEGVLPLGQGVVVVLLLVSLLPRRPRRNPALGGAGGLAVLQAIAEQIPSTRSVELWGVGVGSSTTGSYGVRDLLNRYPFPRAETLFLTLECIDHGVPVCVSHEGAFRQWRADPLLLDLASRAQATIPAGDTAIQIRPYPAATTLALPLHRRGYRTLAILTDDVPSPTSPASPAARSANRQNPEPSGESVSPTAIEHTVQLVVSIIRQLDDANTPSEPQRRQRAYGHSGS